jgi:hypothetical protein
MLQLEQRLTAQLQRQQTEIQQLRGLLAQQGQVHRFAIHDGNPANWTTALPSKPFGPVPRGKYLVVAAGHTPNVFYGHFFIQNALNDGRISSINWDPLRHDDQHHFGDCSFSREIC